MWKLWLDDNCLNDCDRKTPEGFVGAISSSQALDIIKAHGLPEYVSFDHDLGAEDTTMVLLNTLRDNLDLSLIEPFKYNVHSSNPEGSKNIISFMESWKKIYDMSNL